MNRLRAGEWVAALGAVGLLVLLFLNWLDVSFHTAPEDLGGVANLVDVRYGGSLTGWGTLGWFMDVLLCVSIVGGLSLSYMTVKRTSPAWPVGAGVLTVGVASAVFVILVVRLLSLAGDEGPIAVNVQLPAYLGLLCALLIPVGAFLSLKDERTDSPEARAYTPPPARSVPGT
jgi:hypothetical protein